MTVTTDLRRQRLAQAYAQAQGDVRQAAELAGYSYQGALAVLRDPAMELAIAQARQEIMAPGLRHAQIDAKRVMLELGRVAFADIRKLYDQHGNLKPVHQLDDDTAAVVSSVQVDVAVNGRGDDAEPVITKRVKTVDKMAALGLLARHFKIVGDEGDGVNALASALADRLKSARRRIGEEPPQDADYRDIPQQSPTDDYPDDLT